MTVSSSEHLKGVVALSKVTRKERTKTQARVTLLSRHMSQSKGLAQRKF